MAPGLDFFVWVCVHLACFCVHLGFAPLVSVALYRYECTRQYKGLKAETTFVFSLKLPPPYFWVSLKLPFVLGKGSGGIEYEAVAALLVQVVFWF